jgi:hypothetical protein
LEKLFRVRHLLKHFEHFREYDDWGYGDEDRLASAILLSAWIRAAREAWSDDWYGTDTDCCGGEMPDDLVEELLTLACSTNPLRLNRDGRPWAALKASEVSAPPSEPSESPLGLVTAEELDQAPQDLDGLEAWYRAMRIKLEDNRRARASRASERSAKPGAPSETPAGPVSAEELDQAILDRFPGLTKGKLDRMMNEA